jgi:hypothetical protein
MTIYPVDFHRSTEQKWARRAQWSRASETLRHLRLLPPYGLSAPDDVSTPPGHSLLSGNVSTDAERVSAKRRAAQIHACDPAAR